MTGALEHRTELIPLNAEADNIEDVLDSFLGVLTSLRCARLPRPQTLNPSVHPISEFRQQALEVLQRLVHLKI